jgi:hypothetical protein
MTQKEAIDELMLEIDYLLDEIDQHEEFEDDEQGEMQIEIYQDNKRKLEAFQVILGELDPELKTLEGLRERASKVKEERYGSVDAGDLPEPSEIETKLVEILGPWCKNYEKETGYGASFELAPEENLELAKINAEQGKKHIVYDDDPEDIPDASEDDTFTFYTYRGRVQVVYNDYADGDFCDYPEEFQEKAYEIIKAKIES